MCTPGTGKEKRRPLSGSRYGRSAPEKRLRRTVRQKHGLSRNENSRNVRQTPDRATGSRLFYSRGAGTDRYPMAREGLDKCAALMAGGDYDVVILDELTIALHYGLLTVREVLEALDPPPSVRRDRHHGPLRPAGTDRPGRPGNRNARNKNTITGRAYARATGSTNSDSARTEKRFSN